MTVYQDRVAEDGHWASEILAANMSSTYRETPCPRMCLQPFCPDRRQLGSNPLGRETDGPQQGEL